MKKLLFVLLLFATVSCTKEKEHCYQCKDNSGNDLQSACGKDKEDAWNNAGHPNINGSTTLDNFKKYCNE